MSKFNLEAAQQGARLMTRKGKKARIVCFDYKPSNREGELKLIVLVETGDGKEASLVYNIDGTIDSTGKNELDLVMTPKEVTKFVNIYAPLGTEYAHKRDSGSKLHDTEEEAKTAAAAVSTARYITTVPVTWTE